MRIGILFQDGNYGALWTVTYSLGDNFSSSISKSLVKGLNLSISGSMSIKTTATQIIITSSGVNEVINVSGGAQNGNGFGFFTSHYSHGCDQIGSFSLRNCVYTEVNLLPHNVFVDPNGGTWENSTAVSTITGIYKDTRSIGLPVRSGYTFVGWRKIGTGGTMNTLTGPAIYTFGEDETDDRLIAQWIKIDATKQSNIGTGKVAENQEITYTITATNSGTVDGTASIKDAVPAGTTFVNNSIMINGAPTGYTQANLANGINVPIPKPDAGQISRSSTLSFRVKVNKLTNNTLIRNTAQYKDITVSASSAERNTNEIVLKYVEPIISQSKSSLTQNKENFVVNGEKVTYTINISNDGGLGKEVVVRDNIPQGTTFVGESIKINGVSDTSRGEAELKNGIRMQIPEETRNQTISFDVIVNDINDEDIIRNVAIVDEKATNEVTLRYVEPIISQKKEVQTENNLNYVINGEKVKYTITIENAGGLAKDVILKDTIPEGTTFVEGSVRINDQAGLDAEDNLITKEQLENGITINSPLKITKMKRDLANSNILDVLTDSSESEQIENPIYEPSVTTISFEVVVNDINDEDIIRNVATVDEIETNEVNLRYIEPIISQKKEMETENNLDYVVNGEKIKYTVVIENAGGLAKDVILKDIIPEGTTFVEGSIRINDEEALDEEENPMTEEQLESGITINSPEKVLKSEENKPEENESEEDKTGENKPGENESEEDKTEESEATKNELIKNASKQNELKENKSEEEKNEEDKIEGEKTEGDEPEKDKTEEDEPTEDVIYQPSVTRISFEVIVNDIEDEDIISNIASVDEENTNKVSIEYVEPIISIEKTAETQYDKEYVTSDETILYNIIVNNDGSLEKNVVVKDKIPEGVTFVKNSIKVNGERYKDEENQPYDEIDLEEGIEVLVPPKEDIDSGEEIPDKKEGDSGEETPDEKKEDTDEETLNKNEANTEEKRVSKNKANIQKSNDKTKEASDQEENESTQEKDSAKDDNDSKADEDQKKEDDNQKEEDNTNKKDDNDEDKENSDQKEDKENSDQKEDNNQREDEEQPEEKDYIPGKTVLSFEVIVDTLERDTDTAEIVNIATVDDEETNEVTHQVLPFNMKLEKRIKEVTQNGTYQNVGEGKMMKTEVASKTVNTASVIAKYTIVVTNTGKVEGNATVQDIIPEGYKVSEFNPPYWKVTNDGKLQTTTEVIKPEESKELEVVLAWQNGPSNFGLKINQAEIVKTDNESNAEETTLEDNKSDATILMSIKTGYINNQYKIASVTTMSSMILITGIIVIKKKVLG